MRRVAIVMFVLLVLLLSGCGDYLKCAGCGAAFKKIGGLPGQTNYKCRYCGDRLFRCSKEVSGWDDSIPKEDWDWDETPYELRKQSD